MDRRSQSLVVSVLVAFLATTALPGPGLVAHRHGGGDHEHTHAVVERDHEHHHHDPSEHHHDHERPADDGPRGVAADDHDPLRHVHAIAPFQPAARVDAPATTSAAARPARLLAAAAAPSIRGVAAVHVRGPPASSV